MTAEQKPYYTVPQISKILNLSGQTIWRYIKNGKLEAVKIGRAWYVSTESLNKLLAYGTEEQK